jgi:hypothetical protein
MGSDPDRVPGLAKERSVFCSLFVANAFAMPTAKQRSLCAELVGTSEPLAQARANCSAVNKGEGACEREFLGCDRLVRPSLLYKSFVALNNLFGRPVQIAHCGLGPRPCASDPSRPAGLRFAAMTDDTWFLEGMRPRKQRGRPLGMVLVLGMVHQRQRGLA